MTLISEHKQIGLYNECAFVSRGTGQFRPMEGAKPALGEVNEAETVDEEKAEVIVSGGADAVKQTIAELRKVSAKLIYQNANSKFNLNT